MLKLVAPILASALLCAAATARAQARDDGDLPLVPWAHPPQPPEPSPEPDRGGGLIVAGAVLLTVGALTTAAVGSCNSNRGWSEPCVGGVLGTGLGMVTAGGALLTAGLAGHANARKRPPRRVALVPAGAGLMVSASF